MNTKEAIRVMLEGKKIKSVNWLEDEGFFYFVENLGFCDECDIQHDINFFLNEEWEIYEEKNKKVIIEKWLIFDNLTQSYSIAEESNIDGFINDDRKYLSKVKLLETYEVQL